MRLGFVGVGRWASRLAAAFRACGAEIVAYDRGTKPDYVGDPPHLDGFGWYSPWRVQLARENIDAIIAAAPPEITTEVALACAAAGKPVMATKPLWDHPQRITAPFYVDFWRLWSGVHREARERLAADKRARLTMSLYGVGPFRSFPGAFDWGPHVAAALIDLCPGFSLSGAASIGGDQGELFRVHATAGDREITLYFGNGSTGSTSREYQVGDWCTKEEGEHIGNQTKQAVIEAMCQAFMADIAEGFVSTRMLELSRESTRLIRRIREMAK